MLAKIANFIWGDWLVFLIIVTGLHYTYRLKGIQVRKFSYIFKKTFFPKESSENNNKITSLQALKTSLGSCIGNGNIVGVATAVMFGGPGALFWMWVAAIIGMAVKYGEIFLESLTEKKEATGSIAVALCTIYQKDSI